MTTIVSFHEGPSGCEVMFYCGNDSTKTKYRIQYTDDRVNIYRFDVDDGWGIMLDTPYEHKKDLPRTIEEIFHIKENEFAQRNLLIAFVDQIIDSTDVIVREILKEPIGIDKIQLRKIIRKTLLNYYNNWSAIEAI